MPLGGLATPLVPLKILPFLVRGSRLPMRSSEEKIVEEEEEVEVEEREVEETAAGVDDISDRGGKERTQELRKACPSIGRRRQRQRGHA